MNELKMEERVEIEKQTDALPQETKQKILELFLLNWDLSEIHSHLSLELYIVEQVVRNKITKVK